jgi:hypothetical protein
MLAILPEQWMAWRFLNAVNPSFVFSPPFTALYNYNYFRSRVEALELT